MKKSLPTVMIALSALLAACSGSSTDSAAVATESFSEATQGTTVVTVAPVSETTAATGDAAPVGAPVATPNEIDVRFAQGGLGHHAQAVELAEIALDPKAGARPEVLELGKAITAPSPEFTAVEALLTKWGKPLELSKEEMAKMEGMATPETVDQLATLTGSEFDTAFLSTLVKHHEGAIKMANKVLAEGSDTELRPIAERLLQMRTSELVTIKGLLG